MRAGATLAVCLAAAAALPGCGRGGAARDAERVAERFYAAVAERDGGAACDSLSEGSRTALEKEQGEPCEQAVVGLELSGERAAGTSVFGSSARVDLAGGDSVFLDETDGAWKVSAAGCKPVAVEEPYDCELRA